MYNIEPDVPFLLQDCVENSYSQALFPLLPTSMQVNFLNYAMLIKVEKFGNLSSSKDFPPYKVSRGQQKVGKSGKPVRKPT